MQFTTLQEVVDGLWAVLDAVQAGGDATTPAKALVAGRQPPPIYLLWVRTFASPASPEEYWESWKVLFPERLRATLPAKLQALLRDDKRVEFSNLARDVARVKGTDRDLRLWLYTANIFCLNHETELVLAVSDDKFRLPVLELSLPVVLFSLFNNVAASAGRVGGGDDHDEAVSDLLRRLRALDATDTARLDVMDHEWGVYPTSWDRTQAALADAETRHPNELGPAIDRYARSMS